MDVDEFADVFNSHIAEHEDEGRLDIDQIGVNHDDEGVVGLEKWWNVLS
jgi:hypothetical protein